MDDLIKSVDSPQTATAITSYRELLETLKRSEFTLKKWASNCLDDLKTIPVDDRLEGNKFTFNAEPSFFLGPEWIIDKDCLQVCRGSNKECPQDIT